jgi:hypothetical protein
MCSKEEHTKSNTEAPVTSKEHECMNKYWFFTEKCYGTILQK